MKCFTVVVLVVGLAMPLCTAPMRVMTYNVFMGFNKKHSKWKGRGMMKRNNLRVMLVAALIQMTGYVGFAEGADQDFISNTESSADKQIRMHWWKEARFGMFVHWGLYSSAEGEWGDKTFDRGAEWIQKKANVPADVYQSIMLPKFKPAPYFSAQWARLAKQAGAKYVVFTDKHHEGFALHDSAQTEFDAMDATGRDLHGEIVAAIRREGLRVGVYHSLWDWHHPDAPAGEGSNNVKGLNMEGRKLSRYADYLYAQVNEITDGRYGPVDILWLDYSKDQFQGEAWGAKKLVAMVHENQPDILINNRLWKNEVKGNDEYKKYWFGDFSTPEQHIPASGIEGVDWETCDTLNITWGWSKHAKSYKTAEQLIHRLIDAVSKGGNYLLNIGPLPDGTIDPVSVQRFEQIGQWMQINGEAIYGTQAGPFTRLPWGRVTSKELDDGTHRLYLHVFDWPKNGVLHIPGLETLPVRSILVGGAVNHPIRTEAENGKMIVKGLPKNPVHESATVIALDFSEKPEISPYRIHASTDGSFVLEPADAEIEKGVKYHDHSIARRSRLEHWLAGAWVTYPLYVEKASAYRVEIEVAADKLDDGDIFLLSVGDVQLPLELKSTGGPRAWNVLQCAPIELPAGEIRFELKCTERSGTGYAAFSTITLNPVQ